MDGKELFELVCSEHDTAGLTLPLSWDCLTVVSKEAWGQTALQVNERFAQLAAQRGIDAAREASAEPLARGEVAVDVRVRYHGAALDERSHSGLTNAEHTRLLRHLQFGPDVIMIDDVKVVAAR